MNNPKIGELITADEPRDAIHIAVAPVIAAERLAAGQHVGFVKSGDTETVGICDTPIGIVDPFLTDGAPPGKRFWVFLYPNTITSLRHNWTHPALDGTPDTLAARQTIERMADNMGLSYSALMDYARDHASDNGYDDYVTQQGGESWRDNFGADTFWPAYAIVTGENVPENRRDHFFSCSC